MPVQSFRSSIAMNSTFGFVAVGFAAVPTSAGSIQQSNDNVGTRVMKRSRKFIDKLFLDSELRKADFKSAMHALVSGCKTP